MSSQLDTKKFETIILTGFLDCVFAALHLMNQECKFLHFIFALLQNWSMSLSHEDV
jgi:hypothetical protein